MLRLELRPEAIEIEDPRGPVRLDGLLQVMASSPAPAPWPCASSSSLAVKELEYGTHGTERVFHLFLLLADAVEDVEVAAARPSSLLSASR